MNAINGVKVFEVGEVDCFYAPTKEEAIIAANEMMGEVFVGPNGDITLDEVIEYSDKKFEEGTVIQFGEDGEPQKDDKGEFIKISNIKMLNQLTSDGSKVGHYSTSEW